jgi:RimJ/RimL family protein N-acetyltransferase
MHVELETERLHLRPPQPDDAATMLDLFGDADVMRPVGSEPGGIELATEHVTRWIARWNANRMGPFVLVRRTDGRLLGRVGPLVWDTRTWEPANFVDAADSAQVELGWVLAQEHWGQGYATEAALTVRGWLREACGVDRLISLIAPDNSRSAHVAERLGAVPDETIVVADGTELVVWVHPR